MKAVLIPTLTAAKNVDIYNGSFIATTDLDNGNVFAKGDLTLEVKLAESRKKTPMWDIVLKRNGQYIFITQVSDKKYFDYCTTLAQTWINKNSEIGIQEFLRLV